MRRRKQKPPEKSGNFFQVWGKLLRYSKQYAFILILALLFAAGGNILTVIGPSYIGQLTNVIEEGLGGTINMDAIMNIGFILLGLYGFSGAFSLFQGLIMVTVTQKFHKNYVQIFPVKLIDSQWLISVRPLSEIRSHA